MLQKSKTGLTASLILLNGWAVGSNLSFHWDIWCVLQEGAARTAGLQPHCWKTLKVSEDGWLVRKRSPAWLFFPSVNQQKWWIETLTEVLCVRFWVARPWPDAHTQQLLVSSRARTCAHTHTWTQSCRVAIIHSVRSDSPQWLVTNTGQTLHLPATAHHHTH